MNLKMSENAFPVKIKEASCTSDDFAPCGFTAFRFIGAAVSGEIAVSSSRSPSHLSLCDC